MASQKPLIVLPFIALPKLPSAGETADLMVDHVFLYGIPTDIVPDGGPQLISKALRAFCKGLGVTAIIFSGYHL